MQLNAAVILLALAAGVAEAANSSSLPVKRMVGIIRKMQISIETEATQEQMFYDKFACWVEDTAIRKRKVIATGEAEMVRLNELILKLSADIGTNEAAVKNYEQDIKDNHEAQKEADEVWKKERAAYSAELGESDDCIGALRAVFKVLNSSSGAVSSSSYSSSSFSFSSSSSSGGSGGFLQQTDAPIVTRRLRRVLAHSAALRDLSDEDLQELRDFVNQPGNLKARKGFMSAAQVDDANTDPNPFGDYAPRSDRIQGILQEMFRTCSKDGREAFEKQEAAKNAYVSMKDTKQTELATLEKAHEETSLTLAKDKVTIAESREARVETKKDLEDDKAFLAKMMADARNRSAMWSCRSSLRTQELMGIKKAIEILTSPEARSVFRNVSQSMSTTPSNYSVSIPPSIEPHYEVAIEPVVSIDPPSMNPHGPMDTFLQISSLSTQQSKQKVEMARQRTYKTLRAVASRYGSLQIAEIATQLQTSGHFHAVIAACNEMMAVLRAEEKADIEHRDRCQHADHAHKMTLEDLDAKIEKQNETLVLMAMSIGDLGHQIKTREANIREIKREMASQLDKRNAEYDAFQHSVLDHTKMIELLDQAMVRLGKYYKDNDIAFTFLQKHQQRPFAYSIDPDKAPDTPFLDLCASDSHAYQSGNILSMMGMIKEDTKKQLMLTKSEEAAAQASFEECTAGLQNEIKDEKALIALAETTKADKEAEAAREEKEKGMREADKDSQKEIGSTLGKDCGWINTHFDSRYKKRKAEMDGVTQV